MLYEVITPLSGIREGFPRLVGWIAAVFLAFVQSVIADETCMSPYMAKITGQEDYVYVWTLGTVGVGDEQDKRNNFV